MADITAQMSELAVSPNIEPERAPGTAGEKVEATSNFSSITLKKDFNYFKTGRRSGDMSSSSTLTPSPDGRDFSQLAYTGGLTDVVYSSSTVIPSLEDREWEMWVNAAKEDDVEAIKGVLAVNKEILRKREQLSGLTGLHWAADSGSINVCRYLLSVEPSLITELDTEGCQPLHLASLCGYPDVCRLLLDAGSDPTIENYENESSIDIAATPGLKKILMKKAEEMGWKANENENDEDEEEYQEEKEEKIENTTDEVEKEEKIEHSTDQVEKEEKSENKTQEMGCKGNENDEEEEEYQVEKEKKIEDKTDQIEKEEKIENKAEVEEKENKAEVEE